MTKYTKKQLKDLVSNGVAIDITRGDNEKRTELEKTEGWLRQIGFASGLYGCTGMLLQGNNTKQLYAITDRTNAIYIFG
jgi:hypothetical protein